MGTIFKSKEEIALFDPFSEKFCVALFEVITVGTLEISKSFLWQKVDKNIIYSALINCLYTE